MSLVELSVDSTVGLKIFTPFFLILPILDRTSKDLRMGLLKTGDDNIVRGQPKSFKIGTRSR